MVEFLELNIEYETKILKKLSFKYGLWSNKYKRKQLQVAALIKQLNNIKNSVHSLAS